MKHFTLSIVTAAALIAVRVGLAFAAGDDNGTSVPLPGSLMLLVTGAVGLAAAGWWMRK
ncbi:MAG: hypothetical protein ACREM3_16450 [Candidatus Rokuibacteriota bacterium]